MQASAPEERARPFLQRVMPHLYPLEGALVVRIVGNMETLGLGAETKKQSPAASLALQLSAA